MDNWRPDRKVESNQTGFWGVVSLPSVSIKDRSLLVPLVMLNAYLTFSWPNKVSFDRKASGIIQTEIYTGARIGVAGGMMGMRRVSPRCVLAIGRSVGTMALVCPAMFTWIVSLVICSSL
jgi:hypothetical protein